MRVAGGSACQALPAAAMMSAASASTSSALSLVKGRGMSSSDTWVAPAPPRTSKHPLRGLSGLMLTEKPCSFSSFSSLVARVLNAPQLLHASMMMDLAPPEAAAGASLVPASTFLGSSFT